MRGRCLLIGLDGGTFSILDPLMDEGVMPFLRQLADGGVRAELLSVVPPLTPPGWASIMTGRSPGNHGVFDFFTFESPHSRHVRFTNSSHLACETVWSMASRQGRTATVLNFPLTAPPRPLVGHLVPGWVQWRYLRQYCYPPDLYDRLRTLSGFDARQLAMDLNLERQAVDGCPPQEQGSWVQFHIQRERQWAQILQHLMRTEPADLTAIVFDGPDKLQHLLWPLLEPACLDRPLSPDEERLRQMSLDYFRQLDAHIADIVALAGPETNVFIVSDHGFGPSREVFYVNTWLEQNGYLRWDPTAGAVAEAADNDTTGLGLIGWMYKLVDWTSTAAYALTPSSNGIRICIAGERGAEGIPPGDYISFRQRLAEALSRFCDPQTGEPVITAIWPREEIFPGALSALAPDLTLRLRDGGFVSTARSEAAWRARAEPVGTHRPEGIFLAHGPVVARGRRLAQVSVLDVTPTLLYTLGLPIPEDLEGRPLAEVFAPEYYGSQPPLVAGRTQSPEAFPPTAVERQEEEAVLARLRALGYLE